MKLEEKRNAVAAAAKMVFMRLRVWGSSIRKPKERGVQRKLLETEVKLESKLEQDSCED